MDRKQDDFSIPNDRQPLTSERLWSTEVMKQRPKLIICPGFGGGGAAADFIELFEIRGEYPDCRILAVDPVSELQGISKLLDMPWFAEWNDVFESTSELFSETSEVWMANLLSEPDLQDWELLKKEVLDPAVRAVKMGVKLITADFYTPEFKPKLEEIARYFENQGLRVSWYDMLTWNNSYVKVLKDRYREVIDRHDHWCLEVTQMDRGQNG